MRLAKNDKTEVATFISSVPYKAGKTLISGMNRLAGGDYETIVDKGYLFYSRDWQKQNALEQSELP